MRIARVFPSQTEATPVDALAFYDAPGMFDEADEVHVSVAFTWDKRRAEDYLAPQWKHVAPVTVGGPAYGKPGADFVPGMYLKPGYTITSRGCPNHCWFCSVWQREPRLIELPIRDGYILQDDNLLACSERHIINVFRMLGRQRRRPNLRGLEAKLLKPWHVDYLACLWPAAMWFAYDGPEDLEPLIMAGRMLSEAGFDRSRLYCYVLIGQESDTMDLAEIRLRRVLEMGFMPFAMLWRDEQGNRDSKWARFQKSWTRPAAIKAMCAVNCGLTRRSILTGGRLEISVPREQTNCFDSLTVNQPENAVVTPAN
jgi:hypothetical protein